MNRTHLVPTVLLGISLALLAGSGGVVYTERAVVRVSVVAQRVQVEDVALAQTTRLTASVTESQRVTSSQVAVPATAATGFVTFMCSPMTSCPSGYTVAAGTLLESASGAEYRTLGFASFPSCAPSSPVPIRALSAGASGNATAGAVAYGAIPPYIHVSNPWPVTGGADAGTRPLVAKSDIDAARSALVTRATAQLQAKLQSEAAGLSYIPTGAPTIAVASNAAAGANSPAFTVTVTATQDALAFKSDAAQSQLRQALTRQIPAGFRLVSEKIDTTYALTPGGSTVSGSASGYMIPAVDAGALATRLRGQTLSAATADLLRVTGGGSVQIQTAPAAMPWLPMLADHISVLEIAEPAPIRR